MRDFGDRHDPLTLEYWKQRATDFQAEAFSKHNGMMEAMTERDKARAELSAERLSHGDTIVWRKAAEAALALLKTAVLPYVEWFGAAHEGECPEDDTCDCACKPINDALNAALRER